MAQIRVAVFIDGSNLHHRLEQCGWPQRIDIGTLAKRLAGNRQLVRVAYYNVPPPPHRAPAAGARQRRYYARISEDAQVEFTLGYLQRRIVDGRSVYEEKGVDVQIAVDMLTGAFRDVYDVAVLVSSDGDFRPAVEAVREVGKRVEYICFPGATRSSALVRSASVSRQCRRAWITGYDE